MRETLRNTIGIVLVCSAVAAQAATPKDSERTYVLSCIHTYGKGRVFYCALGHQANVYANAQVLQHYLAGIQWAMGDLKADAAPLP